MALADCSPRRGTLTNSPTSGRQWPISSRPGDPSKKIAINSSDLTQFGDGMTLSQHQNALPPPCPRASTSASTSGEGLAVRWLETRTPAEMELYPTIVRIAHAVIAEAFSRKVITPRGVTHVRAGSVVVSRPADATGSRSVVPPLGRDPAAGGKTECSKATR